MYTLCKCSDLLRVLRPRQRAHRDRGNLRVALCCTSRILYVKHSYVICWFICTIRSPHPPICSFLGRFWGVVQGLPIKDCARDCKNRAKSRPMMSTIDVRHYFERFFLVLGLRKVAPWVNCLYSPTTPTVHSTTISRFPCNSSPNGPSFFGSSRFTK